MTCARAKVKQRGAVLLTVMVIMAIIMLMAGTLTNYFLTSEENEVEASLVDVRTYWAMMGHVNYMFSRVGGQGLCGDTDNTNSSHSNTDYFCGMSTGTAASWASKCDQNNTPIACFDDAAVNTSLPFTATNNAFPAVSPTGYPARSLQSYLDGDATLTPKRVEIQLDSQGNAPTFASPGFRRWVYPQQTNVSATDTANPYFITIQALVRDHGILALPNNDRDLRVDISVTDSGTIPVLSDLKDRADRLTVGFCVDDSVLDTGTSKYYYVGCGTVSSGLATPVLSGTTPYEGIAKIQFLMRNAPIPMTPTN